MAVTDRLTGLDSSFLHLERDGTHMHVASTTLFEGPAPAYVEFRDHIESRLHLVPRFRQKLRFVPFGQGRPVWVDDPHLNLAYHVRHTALPAPGSEQQLRMLAARIFSQRLDRSKPLWELWLVEGLEGDRFAIVGKTHHALVDGVSGVDITTVLFDARAGARPTRRAARALDPRARAERRRSCSARRCVERAIEPARDRPRRPRASCAARAGPLRKATEARRRRRHASPGRASPRPELAVQRRRSAPTGASPGCAPSLADLKRIKNELGGTVNDVVLAAVAGRARPLPARPRPRHRRARAAGDGPGQRPHRRTSTARSATR